LHAALAPEPYVEEQWIAPSSVRMKVASDSFASSAVAAEAAEEAAAEEEEAADILRRR
jgi:hypothetical protein